MRKISIFVMLVTVFLAGCSSTKLRPGAADVSLVNEKPAGCQFLGEVMGSQGNQLTSSFTRDTKLALGARNALRNKAAAMGANVVHVQSSVQGSGGGGLNSSTLIGNAYRCR